MVTKKKIILASWWMAVVLPALGQPVLPSQPAPVITAPVLDPAIELRGAALLSILRAGGNLLFMRHAQSGNPRPECPGESNLTDEGRAQARTVGQAIARLKLPVDAVQVSATCRTRQTAEQLALGTPQENADLNPGNTQRYAEPYEIRFKYLFEAPPPSSNRLLVSHIQGMRVRQDGILIDMAEIVVYRGVVNGRALPVARIKVHDWLDLLRADGQVP